MAGTLQTLTPNSLFLSNPTSFRLRNPSFPSNYIVLSTNLVLSKRIPSIRLNNFRILTPIRATQNPNQIGGDGDKFSNNLGFPKVLDFAKPFSNFLVDNFLPIALISGVAVGYLNPSLGCFADKYKVSKFSTVAIFLISGLTLRSEAIGAAAEAWPVGLIGLISILLLTPSFSRLIVQLHLQPQEFVTGLAVFCCMPTTLSSGVALTQLAGGNSALALAMTVISNLLGILIVPFSVSRFLADGVGVSVPTEQLFRSLVLTLLVPLLVGKVCRESIKGLAEFVDKNRKLLSMISALCLGLVPWIQVSRSRPLLLMVQPVVFLVAVGMGMALHLSLLAFNIFLVRVLSAVSNGDQSILTKKENATAFILVASQKTLPVTVAVVEQLQGALGETGLLILPCVAAHLNQIIMDSFLVNFWLRKECAPIKSKAA
ncbi:putative sodium bile acid cotransporter [Dillenia turbinata]|uniref:Probable sodium/metabolite cotransporter BASS4, chloroplastic n=1 Tax=Dillenia turbinata TaxID=194707 RepID=A0AAN8ZAZ4_9MAGN